MDRTAQDSERDPDPAHASRVEHFGADQALHLDCDKVLAPFDIAYQTYGSLNATKTNAILINRLDE